MYMISELKTNWQIQLSSGAKFMAFLILLSTFFGWGVIYFGFPSEYVINWLMWSFAWQSVGFLLGFIFGVPRVMPGQSIVVEESKQQQNMYGINPSRNIEEISDWLTKILVGVGLVQLQQLPENIYKVAEYIASPIGGRIHEPFAAALIIYFSILGFFSGYLLVRLYLTGQFSEADQQAKLPINLRRVLNNNPLSFGDIPGPQYSSPNDVSPSLEYAANKVKDISLSKLKTLPDIVAWARGQLINENYDEALEGFKAALAKSPRNPDILVDIAVTLYEQDAEDSEIQKYLREAVKYSRSQQVSQAIKRRVYQAITFHSLYLDNGYEDAIIYGEEYFSTVGKKENVVDGGIWVNLAAAYGQKYSALLSHSKTGFANNEKLSEIKQRCLNAIKAALRINPIWKDTLRILLEHNYPGKDPEENDLEIFENEQEFRQVLDLA